MATSLKPRHGVGRLGTMGLLLWVVGIAVVCSPGCGGGLCESGTKEACYFGPAQETFVPTAA